MGGLAQRAARAARGAPPRIVEREAELNRRVYGLLGLTAEEVHVVEECTKYAYWEV